MPDIFFQARAVKRVLSDLNVNKPPGPDVIPALVLKQCSLTLARPLANRFNISYRAGVFTVYWKVENVTPFPKKGAANNTENYNPIAIGNSKVMESMANYHLVKYLQSNNLLNERQYGFRRGRSTLKLNVHKHYSLFLVYIMHCMGRGHPLSAGPQMAEI
ncbi:uncharacterized protein LOC135950413 [Calliphora vicina]|uniref:uncharacterized protein LOC135950413 n=1 Tax=Calliphora vicina TaxID=7373 RepID=UPI00325AF472